jgi:hypothetical protein
MNWALRWGGLALCAAVLGLSALSLRGLYVERTFGWPSRVEAGVQRGGLSLIVDYIPPVRPMPGVTMLTAAARHRWRIRDPHGQVSWSWAARWHSYMQGATAANRSWRVEAWLPMWMPAVILLPVTLIAWRRASKFKSHLPMCACGYDVSGLAPGSPCPECAAVIPAARAAS